MENGRFDSFRLDNDLASFSAKIVCRSALISSVSQSDDRLNSSRRLTGHSVALGSCVNDALSVGVKGWKWSPKGGAGLVEESDSDKKSVSKVKASIGRAHSRRELRNPVMSSPKIQ